MDDKAARSNEVTEIQYWVNEEDSYLNKKPQKEVVPTFSEIAKQAMKNMLKYSMYE